MSIDERTPATFGGPGFRRRVATHRDDMREGGAWSPCGVCNEWGRLRAVLLTRPTGREVFPEETDSMLLLGRLDPPRLLRQFEALAGAFRSEGVEVYCLDGPLDVRPNLLFARDLFVMTEEGAVLARMASLVRTGEEQWAAAALARFGIPIMRTPRASAHLEGADVLRLGPRTVAIGIGQRTNAAGAAVIGDLLSELGLQWRTIPVPDGVQHLLGVVNMLDHDLAAMDAVRTPGVLRDLLDDLDIRTVALDAEHEVRVRRSLNFVTLRPRRVLIPAECPQTADRLRKFGVEVREVDVSEYVLAGGGPACAAGILHREPG
jgi:N-dimethylarginine dimethylaminohydrolase